MTEEQTANLPAAFNEWMRRFIDDPAQFTREWKSVVQYMRDTEEGKEPSYGDEASAYLLFLLKELDGTSERLDDSTLQSGALEGVELDRAAVGGQ